MLGRIHTPESSLYTGFHSKGFMECRVSFQRVFGVQGIILGGSWSTGFHSMVFMEDRVLFQGVFGVQGFIPGGL